MTTKQFFTLIFVKKNSEVLLGKKTRGLGVGLWNGFGGKLEKHETIFDCAKRELKEECDITANNLKHIGVVKYEVKNRNLVEIVHIFVCYDYKGSEKASEEMNPIKWYNNGDIPFDKMWPDAKEWYQLMLNDSYFSVHCIYNKEGTFIHDNFIHKHESLEEALKTAD